jgi:surface antigen
VPSIIVLQSGVQGASYFGHVAVVERINADGSVYTSDYNWYANGGWDTLSYWTFTPGPGVSFVWHP